VPTQAAKREALKIAREECARCRGRECGDCSDECGYFRRTASKAEIEEAARIDADCTRQELARRRSNTLLGLRGIEALEDDPDPEFRLGVLAGGLKAEVERLRALLYEVWEAADKGDLDGVDLEWVAKCDKLFASAAGEPEQPTP